jgi:prepilin peptidase CpaA
LPSAALDHVALLGFVAVLTAAALSDVRELIVPNRYSLAIALLFGIHVLASPAPVAWSDALTVAGASLGVGFVLFAFGLFGGGDVKLFAAASLWAGSRPHLFLAFALATAVAGALLAAILVMQRRSPIPTAPRAAPAGGQPVDDGGAAAPLNRWKQPLPYGVAIAAGGVQTAVMLFLAR